MGSCTAQCKILLFLCETVIIVHTILNCPSEERKKKKTNFGCFATLWFSTFAMLYCTIRSLLVMRTLVDEWYIAIKAYKFTVLEI